MGKAYSPELIPEVGVQLPGGRYLFKVDELDDSETTKNGKYQIATRFTVAEPEQLAGNPFFEHFVIGSDDDPSADDPNTWKSYAAGRYKQMLKKAGVAASGDTEADIAAVTGQLVGGMVVQSIEPDVQRNGQPNPYAGQVRSQIQVFFAPGEREVGVDAQPGSDGAGPARPAAPRAAAPPRPAAPAAPKPAAPAAPKGQPSQMTGGQPKPAVPVQTPAKPAAPVAKPTVAPAVAGIACPGCNTTIPRAEFTQHTQTCQALQE